jgi:putative intracellular protease/amidase
MKRSVSPERPATLTRRILLVAAPGSQILDVVGPFQIFTRAAELLLTQQPGSTAAYSVEVITSSPKPVLVTNCGLRVSAHRSFRRVRGEIDTLLIAGGGAVEEGSTGIEVVRWLRSVAGQVRRIGSVCTGAMLLARAGLLNGRKATTHWKWCEFLATKYPGIEVDPDPIFLRDGNVYTSAGVTAGMDLAAERSGAGQAGGHESAQFCPDLYPGNAYHPCQVCGTPARRSGPQATGRNSAQSEADCGRVRIRQHQINARGISQGAADHPGRVSAALSRREPPAGAIGRQDRRQAAQRSSINPIQGCVAFTPSTLFFFPGWNKTNLA